MLEKEKVDAFKEYEIGNSVAMAYLQMTWMAGSIFVSIAYTIFGLSFNIALPTIKDLTIMSVPSLLLYAMFLVYDWRYTKVTKIIFSKLQNFEKGQGLHMKFHVSIDQADRQSEIASKTRFEVSRLYVWARVGFVALIVLWALRIVLL